VTNNGRKRLLAELERIRRAWEHGIAAHPADAVAERAEVDAAAERALGKLVARMQRAREG